MTTMARAHFKQILMEHIPVERDECACGVLLGSENITETWAEHVARELT